MAKKNSISYLDAGVNLDRAETLVDTYRPASNATKTPGVVSEIGAFGALFSMARAGFSTDALLVSASDGVGTKLDLIARLDRYEYVGQDLVAMCVNDIAVMGAKPLFFLDYLASNKIDISTAQKIIEGIAKACKACGCALVGGESAEMPGFYSNTAYDLVGFCVGGVEPEHLISKNKISTKDVLIGFASSGFHANGFSLIRKIIDVNNIDLSHIIAHDDDGEGRTLADLLLEPTVLYVNLIQALLRKVDVRGLAHITGGGLGRNLPRMLPDHIGARIDRTRWPLPRVIEFFSQQNNVESAEAYRVFNMGLGLVGAFSPENVDEILEISHAFGIPAYEIGTTCPYIDTKVHFL